MNSIATLFQKRNVFNLSHDRKLSMDAGQLIPILCEEVLPGDSFKVKTDMLVRCAPMVGPTYHEVNVFTRYFFIPNRIIWSEWEKFITGGAQGTDAPTHPYVQLNNVATGSLADFFGMPVNVATNFNVSALPFRAYVKVFNDWFRDQTLQAEKNLALTSGQDTFTQTTVQMCNWEKDYFTSALPWTQRGDPVTISMGGSADVVIPSAGDQLKVGAYDGTGFIPSMGAATTPGPSSVHAVNTMGTFTEDELKGQSSTDKDLIGTADLSTATPITINDLRLATQIQRMLERLARAGARYVEYILAMFGVRSSDARLQRSEYLGGGKSQVIISEVLQTSKTESGAPQGNMAGHGFSAHRSHEFKKSFEEHGIVLGLMYILPRTAYQQGVSRTWTRTTRWDYYAPLLAHLGEQAVLNKEIYLGTDGDNEKVFGYQGRFDEYRRRESSVHSHFRIENELGAWHMGRIFSSRPALNETFIQANPTKRVFAVTNQEEYWIYLKNDVMAIRPMPKIGEPGFMDH